MTNGRRIAFDVPTRGKQTTGPHASRCARVRATQEHNARVEADRAARAEVERRLISEYGPTEVMAYLTTGALPAGW